MNRQTEQILKDIEKIKLVERWDELPGKTRELNEIMDTYPNIIRGRIFM